jgi:LmbE family N-acetylglucosaminyl deacetylase
LLPDAILGRGIQSQPVIDITDFIRQKLQAIDVYRSQTERMESLEPDNILATARYWGRYVGYVLAEPLRIVCQRHSDGGDLASDAGKERAHRLAVAASD